MPLAGRGANPFRLPASGTIKQDRFLFGCGLDFCSLAGVMPVCHFRDEEAPCTKALAKLRQKYSPEFRGFSNGVSGEACAAFSVGEISVFGADNTLIYDRRGCTARVLSSSYSPKETDTGYSEYLREIHKIFDTFSRDGLIRRADIHGGVHRRMRRMGVNDAGTFLKKGPCTPQKLLN